MRITDSEADTLLADRFLEANERGHFMQSSEWAAVKSNWRCETVIAEGSDGEITGVMRVLIRRLPLFGSAIYCPRGPVFDAGDVDSLEQLTAGARELIRRFHAVGVRAEPDFGEDDKAFFASAVFCGWRFRQTSDPRDMIQPKSLFRLGLYGKTEEEVFAGFHKKLRYGIRLAERRGVKVTEGTRDDIAEFCSLMDVTAERDGFVSRGHEYFYRLWDNLGSGHRELLLANCDGVTVAGGFFIRYGKKTWYCYGASSNEYRAVMPSYLLQWEEIRRAMARGDDVYDLRGFLEVTDEKSPDAGLYRFKKRFGGRLVRLIGEVYLTDHPIKYRVYRRMERVYRGLLPAFARFRKKRRDYGSAEDENGSLSRPV